MKRLITPLLVLLFASVNGQGIDKSTSSKTFNELPLPEKMKVMKQMSPVILKHQADSICAAHNIVLKDAKGLPLDIGKAIAENKLLIENGVVFYLPNGIPSPVIKKETALPNTKN